MSAVILSVARSTALRVNSAEKPVLSVAEGKNLIDPSTTLRMTRGVKKHFIITKLLFYYFYRCFEMKLLWKDPVLVENRKGRTAYATGGIIEIKCDTVGFLQLIGISCFRQIIGSVGVGIEIEPLTA